MARSLSAIAAHLRACIEDGSIKTTLIQTEDLAALCDAAVGPSELPPIVVDALTPHPNWKAQSFSFYAAHFLVGSELTGGDLYGNLKALSSALESQYELGVEHGRGATDRTMTAQTPAEARASREPYLRYEGA